MAEIRHLLDPAKWTFRNQTRMNLLLELARIRLNRWDDPGQLGGPHPHPHRKTAANPKPIVGSSIGAQSIDPQVSHHLHQNGAGVHPDLG